LYFSENTTGLPAKEDSPCFPEEDTVFVQWIASLEISPAVKQYARQNHRKVVHSNFSSFHDFLLVVYLRMLFFFVNVLPEKKAKQS